MPSIALYCYTSFLRRKNLFRRYLVAVFFSVFLNLPHAAAYATEASAAEALDYQVKASWIYAIMDYFHWKTPKSNSSHLTVCTQGLDNVYTFLVEIKQKEKTPVTIIEKLPEDPIDDCHILYISTSEKDQLPHILQKVKVSKVATISSIKGFAKQGGMIEFIVKQNTISLLINLKAMKEAGIIIDSDLLGVSETIYP